MKYSHILVLLQNDLAQIQNAYTDVTDTQRRMFAQKLQAEAAAEGLPVVPSMHSPRATNRAPEMPCFVDKSSWRVPRNYRQTL